jgi:site-specific recombinase XerC
LLLSDVDLADRTLTIRQGKGMADRSIELEKKGSQAVKNYLRSRPQSLSDALFLNYQAEPISERGVQKLLAPGKVREACRHHQEDLAPQSPAYLCHL